MTGALFVDTNVFAYALDSAQGIKKQIAETCVAHLWQQQSGRTSMQVLNELYVTLTRKLPHPLSREVAWGITEDLLAWDPQPTDRLLLVQARDVEARFQINWWDSLIVAAAQLQDCATLLTEDLQDGMRFDGVRVRNPFRPVVAEDPAGYAAEPQPACAIVPRHRGRGRPKRQPMAVAGRS